MLEMLTIHSAEEIGLFTFSPSPLQKKKKKEQSLYFMTLDTTHLNCFPVYLHGFQERSRGRLLKH